MSLLISNQIMSAVCDELESAKVSVQIITAYCKLDALIEMEKHISSEVNDKKLLLRFRMSDILKGSTDFYILDYCINAGWDVFLRFDLHAKTYIVDNKRGIVGSANATNAGLLLRNHGNYEIATMVDLNAADRKKIEALFDQSIYVDEGLYEMMKNEIKSTTDAGNQNNKQWHWSRRITDLYNPKINVLFTYDFPDYYEITVENAIDYLGNEEIKTWTDVKEAFMWSCGYIWLKQILKEHNNEIYYGELTVLLHNALIEDPKPYRKDVKKLLSNMLSWVSYLCSDEITVDRPAHSQRIRLLT